MYFHITNNTVHGLLVDYTVCSHPPTHPLHIHTYTYIYTTSCAAHTHSYKQANQPTHTHTHTDTGVLSDARSTVVDSLVIIISVLTIILCAISLIKSYLLCKVSIYSYHSLSIVLCPSLGCEELLYQTL